MKKMILVLTEDLLNGVIKSQVLTHIKFLKFHQIVDTQILFCYWDEKVLEDQIRKKKTIQKLYKFKINYLKIKPPSSFLSIYFNQKIICKEFLKKWIDIDYIHARTDFCALLCVGLKKILPRSILIWDCRGYAPAEVDYQKNKKLIFFKKKILVNRFKKACDYADKVIVVSSLLKKFVNDNGNNNTFLLPSVASSNVFYFNSVIREKIRNKLKFKKSSKVFIYSGSLKKYQMFEETINFFKNLNKIYKNLYLIILTNDISEAKKMVNKNFNILTFSVNQDKVNEFLNASDYAIMIRRDDLTNNTASPTKFAEYCLTGLQVITNSSVKDFYKFKNQVCNIIDLNYFNFTKTNNKNRLKISSFYKKNISRECFLEDYKRLYE